MGHLYYTLSPKAQESMHKREWKDCKSQGQWVCLRNVRFSRHNRLDNHEFTMTASIRPVQAETRQNPSLKPGDGQCSLAEELLASGGLWETQGQFWSGVTPDAPLDSPTPKTHMDSMYLFEQGEF